MKYNILPLEGDKPHLCLTAADQYHMFLKLGMTR